MFTYLRGAYTYWTTVACGTAVALLIGRFCLPGGPLPVFVVVWLRQSINHLPTHAPPPPSTPRPARTSLAARRNVMTPVLRPFDGSIMSAEGTSASSFAPLTSRSSIDELQISEFPDSPTRPPQTRYSASLASPTSPRKQDPSFPFRPRGHVRSESLADSARQSKRLSLSFPVQPSAGRSSRPTSWYASPMISPEPLVSPAETSFLAKLASQERRVFELKEELKVAEQELEKLKKQWAREEAVKKHNDVRKVHQLQSLSSNIPSLDHVEDDEDGSSEWLQKEMERRKALMSGMKTSNRKVFSGSKHMRTLSLLSPERGNFHQPFPQPEDAHDVRPSVDNPQVVLPPPRMSRAMTTPRNVRPMVDGLDEDFEDTPTANRRIVPAPKGEDLLKTGKQMASDIKEGLLTFWDDIRQATVGEEGISGTETRITQSSNIGRTAARQANKVTQANDSRSSSQASNRRADSPSIRAPPNSNTSSDPLLDIGQAFWRDHGVESTPKRVPSKRATVRTHNRKSANSGLSPAIGTPVSDTSEAWDTWDTPPSSASTRHTAVVIANSQLASSPRNTDSNPSTPLSATTSHHQRSPGASTERTLTPRSSAETTFSATSSGDINPQHYLKHTTSHPRSRDNKNPNFSPNLLQQKDAIPWPALHKLTPTNLRRTASHLMAEWERSLTVPSTGGFAGDRDDDDAVSDVSSGLAYGGSGSLASVSVGGSPVIGSR